MSLKTESSIEAKHVNKASGFAGDDKLVSIIMPIFNRARFLPQAIESIKAQHYEHWELLIVDDGSSDNSIELLAELTAGIKQPITIIQQENQGPAAARNTGIKQAKGAFFAFFDSDDLWLPYHLTNSMAAFNQHPELSWIYSACERVEYDTGKLILQSTFYNSAGQKNKLFSIAKKQSDEIYILDTEKAILLQLTEGIDNGLQNSVLKRNILDKHLIPNYRVGEDRLFIVMALKSGFKMGFIDAIHVRYHVHDENISDTNKSEANFDKRIQALERLVNAKQQLPKLVTLNSNELKVYKQQLSKEIFWELGYSLYQESGDYKKALRCYITAMRLWPYYFKFYRTFIVSLIKYLASTFTRR